MGSPDDRRMTFLFACFKLGAAIILARYAYQYYCDEPLNGDDGDETERGGDSDSAGKKQGKKDSARSSKQPEEEPAAAAPGAGADQRIRTTVDNLHGSSSPNHGAGEATTSTFDAPRIAPSGMSGQQLHATSSTAQMGAGLGAGPFRAPTPQQAEQLEAMRRSIQLGLGQKNKPPIGASPERGPGDSALFFNLLGLYQGIKK